ncbi:MAG TPA: hypothetical protein VHN37_13675 [Actinomycetota bacterium]|nr:hypothetical protein [Actinomycetota bacterium]
MKSRIAVIVIVVAGIAGLGWRLVDAERRLDAARQSAAEVGARTESLGRRLEETRGTLRDVRLELREEIRARRELRREVAARQRCNGPHLWLSPDSGPPGTRVTFVGDCFVYAYNDTAKEATSGYGIFLIRQLAGHHPRGECELIAGTEPNELRIHRGRASGYLTIPTHGSCFQRDDPPYPLPDGPYDVGIGCHACSTNAVVRVAR